MQTPYRTLAGIGLCLAIISLFIDLQIGKYTPPKPFGTKEDSVQQPTTEGAATLEHPTQYRHGIGVASETASTSISNYTNANEAIGSEGYGPLVQKALATRDPKIAARAVNLIESCKLNGQIRQGIEERLRGSNKVSPEKLKIIIEDVDKQARFCQTLTPDLMQRGPELARIGMHGGEPGLAIIYLSGISGEIDASEKSTVVAALVSDAMAGDVGALAYLVEHGATLEISAIDRRSYFLAMQHRASSPQLQLLESVVGPGVRTPLPAHQESEALKRSRLIKIRN